jgi:hypothetical protein
MKVSSNVHAGLQFNQTVIYETAVAYAKGIGAVAVALNIANVTQININVPINIRL